jgi:hypothetical protein
LGELDTLWVGAVLTPHRSVIESSELVAAFDDLHAQGSRSGSSVAPSARVSVR